MTTLQHIRKGTRTPRLSFDMDGVMSNFTLLFINMLNSTFNRSFKESDWTTYNGPFAPEEFKATWDKFLSTEDVWNKEPEYAENYYSGLDIDMMNGAYNGYFVTRRSDSSHIFGDASRSTKNWLNRHCITNYTAIICGHYNRVDLLKMLEIDAHIDDSESEWESLNYAGIPCYLIDRPYNQQVNAGELRVKNVNEFTKKALAALNRKLAASV